MANLLDSRFRRSNVNRNNEFTLDRNMLTLLAAVDEKKALRQVAAEVNLEPEVFKQSFTKLLKLKLIEEVEDERNFLDPAFIEKAEAVLVELAGPLGKMLIEEAAEDLAFPLNRVPRSYAADLVNRTAQKLPGDKEGSNFKKRMLEEIKSRGM